MEAKDFDLYHVSENEEHQFVPDASSRLCVNNIPPPSILADRMIVALWPAIEIPPEINQRSCWIKVMQASSLRSSRNCVSTCIFHHKTSDNALIVRYRIDWRFPLRLILVLVHRTIHLKFFTWITLVLFPRVRTEMNISLLSSMLGWNISLLSRKWIYLCYSHQIHDSSWDSIYYT